MKKLYVLCMLALVSSSAAVYGQACTPDPAYTQTGVYPDTGSALTPGCVGDYYSQVFTVVVPPDTTVGPFTVTVNSMQVTSVTGMPAGFAYNCTPASCTYPGGNSGCLEVFGTPATAGTFVLTFNLIVNYTSPFGPGSLPLSYSGYKIRIGTHPTLSTGSASSLCGSPTGSAWVSATGSTGYSYSWNTSPVTNNDSILNVQAGAYQVTVADTFGCATTDTVVVANIGGPVIDTILSSPALCYEENSGSLSAQVSAGTAPYTYVWDNGDTTANINNLVAGLYVLTVYDDLGCQATASSVVHQPAFSVLASATGTDISCNGETDGSVNATGFGGTGGYDFLWSSGQTTAAVPNLGAGTYTVTLTDDNGCTGTASVTIAEPSAINIGSVVNEILCAGDNNGGISLNITGGTPGYEIDWNTGDTLAVLNNIGSGTYQVQVTDASGCTATNSFTLTAPTAVNIVLTPTSESIGGASDGAVNATVTGGTAPYDYAWSNSQTTEDISGLPGGTYTVTVTDDNGCTTSASVTVPTLPGAGIEETEDLAGLYPNPAVEMFSLVVMENCTLNMYDMTGKLIMSKNMQAGNHIMQVPAAGKGIYLLNFSNTDHQKTLKLIVE